MKVYILDHGRMKLDKNLLVSGAVLADADNPCQRTEFVEFPLVGYLIKGPEGYILYDTGAHPQAMGPGGRWPIYNQKRSPLLTGPKYCVLNRLKDLNIAPDEIKTIILSHMHLDHAGCIEYFPHARFIVHEGEFKACLMAYATHNNKGPYIYKDIDTWIKMKLNWSFITDEDSDMELFDGLTIINLGRGHCEGLLALQLKLKNTGNVIITSDAIYSSLNYKGMRLPGLVYDTLGWLAGFKRIEKMARQTHGVIWFGHDMEQFAVLKKSDEGYYD